MSSQKRKISYWGVEFLRGDDVFFDKEIFLRFLEYCRSLSSQQSLIKDSRQNKAISIEAIRIREHRGTIVCEIILKSCKFNHSPDYMSSLDGTERPTDKSLDEGEKEKTHMCMRVDDEEAYTVFEDRRTGVGLGPAINYFNHLLKQFVAQDEQLEDDFSITASIIPPEDFLSVLESAQKINIAELFVERELTGSEFLNEMKEDQNAQDDIIVTVKAKPRKSLGKRALASLFNSITTEGSVVRRIRLRGKDINKASITIDSLHGKKVDEIDVDLLRNGTVDSVSIMAKLKDLLGVKE